MLQDNLIMCNTLQLKLQVIITIFLTTNSYMYMYITIYIIQLIFKISCVTNRNVKNTYVDCNNNSV